MSSQRCSVPRTSEWEAATGYAPAGTDSTSLLRLSGSRWSAVRRLEMVTVHAPVAMSVVVVTGVTIADVAAGKTKRDSERGSDMVDVSTIGEIVAVPTTAARITRSTSHADAVVGRSPSASPVVFGIATTSCRHRGATTRLDTLGIWALPRAARSGTIFAMPAPLDVATVNDVIQQSFASAHSDGLRCEGIGDGWAMARWTYQADRLRPGDYIPGPVMFGLADVSLWMAVFSEIGVEVMAVTSEMSIRFLRPAQGGDLLARASIDSVSSRRLVGTIQLWVDGSPDRLVAVAQGTYVKP